MTTLQISVAVTYAVLAPITFGISLSVARHEGFRNPVALATFAAVIWPVLWVFVAAAFVSETLRR